MKVLFINTSDIKCSVHQYGVRLHSIMSHSVRMTAQYMVCPSVIDPAMLDLFDVVIYNYHPAINDAIAKAPYKTKAKQVAIFHEGNREKPFDMWIFSDPSQKSSGNTAIIGRPLPLWEAIPRKYDGSHPFTVGLSGFCGAWSESMVSAVLEQEPCARIRLALPCSDRCDPYGINARAAAESCLSKVADKNQIEVTHSFMPESALLKWLSDNDVNCYIRTPEPSVGVSSALDMALAVRRPIVINRHSMFRHMHDCNPSICIEDASIYEIISNGLSPLIHAYQRNARELVLSEIEDALLYCWA
jgi:hypothetical protein